MNNSYITPQKRMQKRLKILPKIDDPELCNYLIKKRLWKDRWKTICHYYRRPRFAFVDLFFALFAFFSNPYRTCRRFLQKRGESEVYAYGETPFSTLQRIAEQSEIHEKDSWLELGSGRGKGCFWMAEFIGCQTIGVEWVPQFVLFASFLKNLFHFGRVSFQLKNIEEANFSFATVVYLYGTCLSEKRIQNLTQKMEKELSIGAKVVTISYPLDSPYFHILKNFSVSFPWGETIAYFHIKVNYD
jgi:hypothetical protein